MTNFLFCLKCLHSDLVGIRSIVYLWWKVVNWIIFWRIRLSYLFFNPNPNFSLTLTLTVTLIFTFIDLKWILRKKLQSKTHFKKLINSHVYHNIFFNYREKIACENFSHKMNWGDYNFNIEGIIEEWFRWLDYNKI